MSWLPDWLNCLQWCEMMYGNVCSRRATREACCWITRLARRQPPAIVGSNNRKSCKISPQTRLEYMYRNPAGGGWLVAKGGWLLERKEHHYMFRNPAETLQGLREGTHQHPNHRLQRLFGCTCVVGKECGAVGRCSTIVRLVSTCKICPRCWRAARPACMLLLP
jgi:hypothetical protein